MGGGRGDSADASLGDVGVGGLLEADAELVEGGDGLVAEEEGKGNARAAARGAAVTWIG